MGKTSPSDLWDPVFDRFTKFAFEQQTEIERRYIQLAHGENIDKYHHESLQQAMNEFLAKTTIDLTQQADEYEEAMRAQDIWDSLNV